MIFAILLTSGALIVLAFLTFNLAVYALPFFAGVSAAAWAHAHGLGSIGAGLVGLCTGALVLAFGQTLLATTCSPVLRLACLGAYLIPAAVAGYAITQHIAGWTSDGAPWRTGFAVIGAAVTCVVAYVRLAEPLPGGPGGAFGRNSQGLSSGRTGG